MEIAIIVVYGAILGLVAPYLTTRAKEYGVLLPPAIATVTGTVAFSVLTWLGVKSDQAWAWALIMLSMPVVMIIVSARIAAHRAHVRELENAKR